VIRPITPFEIRCDSCGRSCILCGADTSDAKSAMDIAVKAGWQVTGQHVTCKLCRILRGDFGDKSKESAQKRLRKRAA